MNERTILTILGGFVLLHVGAWFLGRWIGLRMAKKDIARIEKELGKDE